MARVFVSYRRADGLYGVGWLAERLCSLDSVNGVQTAFHDAALRAGDDFPNALEDEIAGADLVLAVIGPEWLGARNGESPRITDGDDWVVREIAIAFQQGTRVMPILMDGAEHPLASQMHPSIADLARLHAIPFADGRDLDVVVDHVESHLTEIDHERARRAGLEQPIEVPRLEHPWRLAVLSVCTAIVGGVLGWLASWYKICPGGTSSCEFTSEPGAAMWFKISLTAVGVVLGSSAVVGTMLVRRLTRTGTVNWSQLAVTTLIAVAATVLAIASFESGQFSSPSNAVTNPTRNWIVFGLGLVLVLPWPLLLNAPGTSEPIAPRHHLADRIRYIGSVSDAERWAALILSLVIALGIGAAAAMTHATNELDEAYSYRPVLLVAFALIFSAALTGSHLWNLARQREFMAEVRHDLADLSPRYRQNAEPRVVAAWLYEGGWVFRALLALPLVTAIVVVAAVEIAT